MAAEEVKIGPFVGGLNTFSDPTAIDDVELTECDNFDMYLDGTLVNRPPINDLSISLPGSNTLRLLGWYVSAAGAPYLIGTDTVSSTYYFNGASWTLITNTFAAAAMTQYRDKAWLIAPPGSANPGGKWDLTNGFVAVASMPKGQTVVAHKERLWIGPGKGVTSNGSRIYFCAISDPDSWPGDFISISTGDGQNVLELMVYYQDLLIFKSNSTYRFSYDIDPALGTIGRVSDTVGVLGTGCVTTFENRIFVLHDNYLYELSNYSYERLNDKVPFEATNAGVSVIDTASLSYFSSRIFVAFYDKQYVWSVKTRTWATWSSSVISNMGRVFPVPGEQDNEPLAYVASRTTNTRKIYSIIDAITANSEQMICTIKTKNYDYQTASRFKRIMMWGLDCITRSDITGTIEPVEYASTTAWAQLKLHTWAEVKTTPWGRLLGSETKRVDTVPISGLTGERKFIKLGDISLRFRQVGFKVEMETDGSINTAPVVIFNIITWVKDKQTVSKRIS